MEQIKSARAKYTLENLVTGDIVLVSRHEKDDTVITDGIKFFQNNKWHHALSVVVIGGKAYVAEAAMIGVQLTTFDKYLTGKYDAKVLKIEDNWLRVKQLKESNKIRATIMENCGNRPYDFKNLFVYQPAKYISQWLNWKTDWFKESHKSNKRYICGEFSAHMMHLHFPQLFGDWWRISPEEIDNRDGFLHFDLSMYKKQLAVLDKRLT